MHDNGVTRVKMARYKRHRNQLFSGALDVCRDLLELLATIAAILFVAIPAGIGFGWGLAVMSAIM